MSIINLPLVQFGEFQSITLFDLQIRGPGTYRIPLQVRGNSILSSLLVTEIATGASIKVNYFQTTTGNEIVERSELAGHTIKTAASTDSDTIIVARMHFKPVCEVIIEGGDVKFGLMATMVSAFASDIESSLFRDQQNFIGSERGIPLITVDDETDSFRFLRSRGGKIITSESEGEDFHLQHSDTLNHHERKTIIAHECFSKALKIANINVSAFGDFKFMVRINGRLVSVLRTSSHCPNDHLSLTPFRIASRGSLVTIEAERLTSVGLSDCDVLLGGYEFIKEVLEEMSSFTKVVFNKSGALIMPFKAVAWVDDNSVVPADADGIGIADFAGVTQDGIAHLGYGKIHKLGEVPGALVGFGAVAGQPVYLGDIPGQISLIAPTSGTIFRIGFAEPPGGAHTGEATSLFIDPQIIAEA